jgi:hypothetical protein
MGQQKHPYEQPQVPLLHWPPFGELLQSEPLEHPQLPPLHAVPFAALLQSPLALHPQAPLLLHWLPLGAEEQSTHVPPDGAHAELPIAVHWPELQQKPVPHVPSEEPPQEAPQVPPAPHVGFCPPHTAQTPFEPHESLAVPAMQVPALQQPPWQRDCPLHALEHVPPLHASYCGQSLELTHPAPVSTWPLSTTGASCVTSAVTSCILASAEVTSLAPASMVASSGLPPLESPASSGASGATEPSLAVPPSSATALERPCTESPQAPASITHPNAIATAGSRHISTNIRRFTRSG